MTKPVVRLVALLSISCSIAHACGLPKNLEYSVSLYLSAASGYQPGDLIALSQLKEIQRYLSRTQGNSLATHLKWRHLVLPDSAPLVRIFHAGGAPVLREIAAELGSYAALDRLSRSGNGREQLRQAIQRKSPAELIQILAAEQAEFAAELADPAKKLAATARPQRIYTAAEFFSALAAPLPVEPATENRATAASPRRMPAAID